jgi:hypothetical protein
VLLADPAHGHNAPVRVGDRDAEYFLGPENALGVVPQRPVPEVGQERLGSVELVVNRQVVLDLAAPLVDAGQGVVVRVRHGHCLHFQRVMCGGDTFSTRR